MGRRKLVDYFKVWRVGSKKSEPLSLQQRFQQYLEEHVVMVYNYLQRWLGVKPHGYLNTLDLASVETSWGKHYVLNIVVPYDVPNFYKIERGIIKYVLGVFPLPDFVDIKVYEGRQFGREADVIVVEAKQALVTIFD
ncbi:hypothetical protein D878_gp23 [Sulfolobales Mexican rudivirus 1]|jgi:hypothetical protein|uniref:Uncharacterized protein n=1 Tax=Sulfolobales Mexican rod-shaped virus 1 TaxID=2848122 RepID=K4NZH2_9VIRU|nr:hypothetical protein D878_gp23 [Sulfolobales Mexican rudivirus 1]AFV51250.1 hypothetical protein [Sulfolobales Mexican rod-shaped virus 1]